MACPGMWGTTRRWGVWPEEHAQRGEPPTPQLVFCSKAELPQREGQEGDLPRGRGLQGAAGGWGDEACVGGETADGDEGAGRWGSGLGPAGCAGKATGARF